MRTQTASRVFRRSRLPVNTSDKIGQQRLRLRMRETGEANNLRLSVYYLSWVSLHAEDVEGRSESSTLEPTRRRQIRVRTYTGRRE